MTNPAVLLMAALLTVVGWRKSEHDAPAASDLPVMQVATMEATVRQHTRTQQVAGTVKAKLRSVIEAKTSGRIASMPVRLGQRGWERRFAGATRRKGNPGAP